MAPANAAAAHMSTRLTDPNRAAPSTLSSAQSWTVVIPTTAGPVLIEELNKRREPQVSAMNLTDDYNALVVEDSYVRFIEQVLSDKISYRGPYQMCLSGRIESGRSWELPVALAHLIFDAGRLSLKIRAAADASAPSPAGGLIWATGSVKPNFEPIVDDYKISAKLALSQKVFSEAFELGQKIMIVLPAGAAVSPQDRATLTDSAERWGADVAELETADDILAMVAKLAPAKNEKRGAQAGDLARQLRWPAFFTVAATAALALGSSYLDTVAPKAKIPHYADIAIHALHAPANETCQSAIYSDRSIFDVQPAARENGVFVIRSGPTLCGFQFTNMSSKAMRFGVDPQLMDAAIIADGEVFQSDGQKLAPSWQSRVLLRQAVPERDVAIWYGDTEKRRTSLRLTSTREVRQ